MKFYRQSELQLGGRQLKQTIILCWPYYFSCLDPKLEPMAQQMSAKAVKAMLRKECKARIAAIPKLIKESQSRRLTQMVISYQSQ